MPLDDIVKELDERTNGMVIRAVRVMAGYVISPSAAGS
jgi:hypothetical protein